MQQIEQGRDRVVRPAERDAQTQNQRFQPDSGPILTAALQAVQAGVPLQSLPAPVVLALSASVGNSGLLDLLALQSNRRETATAPMEQPSVQTEPFQVGPVPQETVSPPAWTAFPAAQAAPASPAGLQ